MRAYLWASGAIFILITLAHVVRVVAEGMHTLADPIFVISSLLAVGMTAWSIRLLRR